MKISIRSKPDFVLRVVGSLIFSHLVETLDREETFLEQAVHKNYWIALLSGWLIAFMLATYISWLSAHFDRKISWLSEPFRRLFYQFIAGIVVPAALLLVLTSIQHYVFWGESILDQDYVLTELPFAMSLIFIVNLWYVIRFLVQNQSRSSTGTDDSVNPFPNRYIKVLMVSHGKSQVPLDVTLIRICRKKGDYVQIHTSDKTYLTSLSLEDLEKKLDSAIFFRANRQYIVNFTACKRIMPIEFGKIEIISDPPADESIIVSQKRQKAFKDWLINR
jgi:hypothetical protein